MSPDSRWPAVLSFLAGILVITGVGWNLLLHAPVPWLPLVLIGINVGLGWWGRARGERFVAQFSAGAVGVGLAALWLGPVLYWSLHFPS